MAPWRRDAGAAQVLVVTQIQVATAAAASHGKMMVAQDLAWLLVVASFGWAWRGEEGSAMKWFRQCFVCGLQCF